MQPNENPFEGWSGDPRYYEILTQMAKIYVEKDDDYSEDEQPLSNLRQSDKIGLTPFVGVVNRMLDKWSRISRAVKKAKNNRELTVKTDSLENDLLDNANYSVFALMFLREQKGKIWGNEPTTIDIKEFTPTPSDHYVVNQEFQSFMPSETITQKMRDAATKDIGEAVAEAMPGLARWPSGEPVRVPGENSEATGLQGVYGWKAVPATEGH